jgi:hypothetical protein
MSYILCQAQGGLNDIMVQIWLCTEYALKYNREIILTHWSYFGSELFDVFDFSEFPVKIHPLAKLREIHYSNVEPADCEDYVKLFLDNPKNTNTIGSVLSIDKRKFDRTIVYPESTLLLHDSCGGGLESVKFIKNINFTKAFKEFYAKHTINFPSIYNAIHIRHTDMKINSDNLLRVIDIYNTIPLFVGTDDTTLKQTILQKYANTFSTEFTCTTYHTLHYSGIANMLEFAIVDLFMMVFSVNNIYDVYALANETIISGYCRLVDELKKDKHNLLIKLI